MFIGACSAVMPQGAYAYGDYCSGELFMWNNNASTVLLDTPRSITSFGEDNKGEVYILLIRMASITKARSTA